MELGREGQGVHMSLPPPSTPTSRLTASCQVLGRIEKILLKLGKELLPPTSKIPLPRTPKTNAGYV